MRNTTDRREAQKAARDLSKWDSAIVMVFKVGTRDCPEYEIVKKADREEYHKQSYPLVTYDCGWEITY